MRKDALFDGSTPPKKCSISAVDSCHLNIEGVDKLPKQRNEILVARQGWDGAIGINKVTPPQEKRPLKGLWAANFSIALTANAQPPVRRTTMSR